MQRAKEAIERINADTDGFATALTWVAPTGETAIITGVFVERTIQVFDDKGNGSTVNTLQSNAGISEKALTDLNYPTRNAKNEVALKGHKVTATNSAGITRTLKVKETQPDSTIGQIVVLFEALAV
jgi:hypothetical protein